MAEEVTCLGWYCATTWNRIPQEYIYIYIANHFCHHYCLSILKINMMFLPVKISSSLDSTLSVDRCEFLGNRGSKGGKRWKHLEKVEIFFIYKKMPISFCVFFFFIFKARFMLLSWFPFHWATVFSTEILQNSQKREELFILIPRIMLW